MLSPQDALSDCIHALPAFGPYWAAEDTFRTEFGSGLVRIAKDRFSDRCSLTVVDRDGTMIDEYHPVGEETLLAIERLYKKARGQALDLDQRLKTVFAHLKSLAGDS